MAVPTLISLSLIFFLVFPAALPVVKAQEEPYVGVNIGRNVSNLLPPSQLVSFLQQLKVTHIRIYDSDPEILKALSKTNIGVIISVPNNQIPDIGSSNTTAANWINKNVAAFYPDTLITAVAVGNEVLTTAPTVSSMLMPAIESLYSALVASNLQNHIKISTPHAGNIILEPFPPSKAHFNQTLSPVITQLLKFLSRTNSPLMMNMYPYHVYMQNKGSVPIAISLFNPIPASQEMVDSETKYHYRNVFDAMIDSAYASMKKLDITDVVVLVTETGWPSAGDSKEPYATIDNADTYNSNLIRHVLDHYGTPWRSLYTSSVYIYELFNEDLRSGPVSEANWGLFYANSTPVYKLQYAMDLTWCVAKDGADVKKLQAAIDWACGPGKANCSAIQQWKTCFSPNTIKNHASYAFDSYYEKVRRIKGSCDFKGAAIITYTDPSHGICVFPGSTVFSNITFEVGNSRNAPSGTSTSATRGMETSRCSGDNMVDCFGLIIGVIFCLFML